MNGFFTHKIGTIDNDINHFINKELCRQQEQIELIASENIVSKAVLEAQGSVLTNKYAEGYTGKRYYGGCEYVDEIEKICIERVCKLFKCNFANVQPHSGSQANQAVFLAMLKPGDTILSLSLPCGGHLTHGAKPNMSGKWFNIVHYDVDPITNIISMDDVRKIALESKPKLIIAGASAYARTLNFEEFRKIADEVGAHFMADIAHYSGLIATGLYPSPFPHAHVVTSTTHKTLRGPRGGIILSNDALIAKKINSAIFPGLQGGPLMHIIAAKAVSFQEALQPSFKEYIQNVLDNALTMSNTFKEHNIDIVGGTTDCHMVLLDLKNKKITGDTAEKALEAAHITCNKNCIPFDTLPPSQTSGLRLGTPAITTRGFGTKECKSIAQMISKIINNLSENNGNISQTQTLIEETCLQSIKLCKQFPIY